MMHQIMFRTMIRRSRIERNASYAEMNERRINSSTTEKEREKEKEEEKENPKLLRELTDLLRQGRPEEAKKRAEEQVSRGNGSVALWLGMCYEKGKLSTEAGTR